MRDIVIEGGRIFRPDCEFHAGTIAIHDGRITDNIPDKATRIHADGMYVIPGLTDIHFHGCKGHDFCEGTKEAFTAITDYEAMNGITTICPATMTLPENELARIMRAARDFARDNPQLAGINLEGPFISHAKKGAQNPAYIVPPDPAMFRRLQEESGGLIRIATVAPETEGAMTFIREAEQSARVSIAHTECDYDTARLAFMAGASHVTHLFNAMNPVNHRQPGPVIAALEAGAMVEIIADGVHVHPAVVRMTLKLFGADRVAFISDSLEAAGMPDGEYTLGGLKVIKNGRRATLEDGMTLAGSVTNLMECVRRAVSEMDIPLEVAVRCAAVNPARAVGLGDVCGRIEAGRVADIVMLDGGLNVAGVIRGGEMLQSQL
ncbi:MAG: N-acetylglucosamine-6-phosphate deacetylase [Synergistaceae bacterium]|nr:N-acetylglucosamine-6-phosphate deacetylase [Synergistaceae bacterium]